MIIATPGAVDVGRLGGIYRYSRGVSLPEHVYTRFSRYPLQDKCDVVVVVVDVGKREQICLNETTISHKSRIARNFCVRCAVLQR